MVQLLWFSHTNVTLLSCFPWNTDVAQSENSHLNVDMLPAEINGKCYSINVDRNQDQIFFILLRDFWLPRQLSQCSIWGVPSCRFEPYTGNNFFFIFVNRNMVVSVRWHCCTCVNVQMNISLVSVPEEILTKWERMTWHQFMIVRNDCPCGSGGIASD